MMNLYSGTTCPFSQRCRIVLYEKGMDFQITEQELISTWLAEGGTLLMGDPRAAAGTLDPIMDIGLDSITRGFGTWGALVAALAAFGLIEALKTGPRDLTQNDIDAAVLHTLEKQPPEPSRAAIAYSVIAPSVVLVRRLGEDDDGEGGSVSGEDYLTVDYARLVPLLIESIKQLSAEIEELKSK